MAKRRIHINESQLYRLVEKVISEDLANEPNLSIDASFKTAFVTYNRYGGNPGPMSPIKGFNEKIANKLLSSLEWTPEGNDDYLYGTMMAEVEGVADDGNLCDVAVEAEICAVPYCRSIAMWTRMRFVRGSVWDGKSGEYIPHTILRVDGKGIREALDNAIGDFVKKGGLDGWVGEEG